MKKLFIISATVAIMLFPVSLKAAFGNESLNYQIIYHWGLIWKHAGDANLTLKNNGAQFNARLTAKTRSWADKIFKVRDTLACVVKNDGFRPLVYSKSAHEGKSIVHDVVRYEYSGNTVKAVCTHDKKGRARQNSEFSAATPAFDMLSVFYFIRTLSFDSMKKNTIYTSTVFSGRRKETLRIRYVGTEVIELRDKSRHKAYHVKFSFTQDGQKKSSDDLDTWISMDAVRIPLMLRGKLPIGEVRCYYAK